MGALLLGLSSTNVPNVIGEVKYRVTLNSMQPRYRGA
jgi:hypothetical protein